MNMNDMAYILFGVILIATFIAIFFFTYVAKVEGEVIKNQITDIVDDLTESSTLVFTPDQLQAISVMIEQRLKMPDMSKEDQEARENNDRLKQKALKYFGIGISIGIIIILVMWKIYDLDMLEIIKYSLITLILVGITEYLFVTIVSKNYVIIDPNYVRYLIAITLRNYANS